MPGLHDKVIQKLPPFWRNHPILTILCGLGGSALTIIGIPGILGDAFTWIEWMKAPLFRSSLVLLGFVIIVAALVFPVLAAVFEWRVPWEKRQPDIQSEGEPNPSRSLQDDEVNELQAIYDSMTTLTQRYPAETMLFDLATMSGKMMLREMKVGLFSDDRNLEVRELIDASLRGELNYQLGQQSPREGIQVPPPPWHAFMNVAQWKDRVDNRPHRSFGPEKVLHCLAWISSLVDDEITRRTRAIEESSALESSGKQQTFDIDKIPKQIRVRLRSLLVDARLLKARSDQGFNSDEKVVNYSNEGLRILSCIEEDLSDYKPSFETFAETMAELIAMPKNVQSVPMLQRLTSQIVFGLEETLD